MKKIMILFGLLLFTVVGFAQATNGYSSKTNIYIVRHAEKESGKDPLLTNRGRQRAGDLMRILASKNVTHIYVSQYRRTQFTADSMRIQLGIDTIHYSADTLCDDLLQKIISNKDKRKTILIIAHSNTIPKIIRKLGVSDYPQADIPDIEFDDLFLIKMEGKRIVVVASKYGWPSNTPASME